MSKKDFIALADAIRKHNEFHACGGIDGLANRFTQTQIVTLARFCEQQNPRFMRGRWLDYIAGKCGKNGGKVRELANA